MSEENSNNGGRFAKNKQISKLLEFYDRNYKKLLIIPMVILILSIGVISYKYAATGDFVEKDISLKGGITITIPSKDIDADSLKIYLSSEFPGSDISVRTLTKLGEKTGVTISASDIGSKELLNSLKTKLGNLDYGVEEMGSSLGKSFFKETFIAILFAFLFMAIIVFFYFRQPIPSLAIMLSAFSNMVVTLAVINLMGVKLSTAGVAAFLMLIGYSVDTNILLSTKVLKRRGGEVIDRIVSGMKTGLAMTSTTVIAVAIAYIFSQSAALSQIMLILIIGLLMDILSTWVQNAGILRLYLERRTKNE
ncbi:MAG: protein translocase subunit SecF [Nanoarchaeota archaeon]|nr:protein translocase subunit SecF [Nanoarchaeota archaeon]MBU4283540.1 protein translocase subunit SecF [Nanoarchaeota archaeon]MBU4493406.1 protein translocase subunit SecF [Nanoarchaeota archaeon]